MVFYKWMTINLLRFLQLLFLIALATVATAQKSTKKYLLFVGTYTDKGSKGIYAYNFDAASAKLTSLGVAAETTNGRLPCG